MIPSREPRRARGTLRLANEMSENSGMAVKVTASASLFVYCTSIRQSSLRRLSVSPSDPPSAIASPE